MKLNYDHWFYYLACQCYPPPNYYHHPDDNSAATRVALLVNLHCFTSSFSAIIYHDEHNIFIVISCGNGWKINKLVGNRCQ